MTIAIFVIFLTGITLNSLWFPLVLLLRLIRARTLERRIVNMITGTQARFYTRIIGVRVRLEGRQHFEGLDGKPLCVISNHQGALDIPVVVGWIPFPCGFVAKQELGYLPPFFIQMWYLKCVLINRRSPRSSIRAIDNGVRMIKKGYPMLIFPEGTRSRSSQMNEFKKGSLKLATRSDAVILPITINGSYRAYEEYNKARATDVIVRIHPPINVRDLNGDEISSLHSRLEMIIKSGLDMQVVK